MPKKQLSTAFGVLAMLSVAHMLNDTLQSIISATYPLLKSNLLLNYAQIGIITLVFQLASSVFQPIVGWYTDKNPQPYSLAIGMTSTMFGLVGLAFSTSFPLVLVSVFFIGLGSSIFHPEATRLAYLSSGGRFGLAQSIFQVGGNFGSSLGPLLAMWIVTPYGQKYISGFAIMALFAIGVMLYISRWYKANLYRLKRTEDSEDSIAMKKPDLSNLRIGFIILVLLILIFSKYVYMASLTNYYMFYLMKKFSVSINQAQIFLFLFLFSVAVGTVLGGPIGDKFGRKYVIWFSILGTAPFSLLMPYATSLLATCLLSMMVGLVLSSAFSAIIVYAQELLPGKVGLVGGLFFGTSLGIAGIAAATLGKLADLRGIYYVYHICSYLPLLGLVAIFLPNMKTIKKK